MKAEGQVQKVGEVIKTPAGGLIENPYLKVAERTMRLLTRVTAELGMTPSARGRLKVAEDEEESSLVAELFRQVTDG